MCTWRERLFPYLGLRNTGMPIADTIAAAASLGYTVGAMSCPEACRGNPHCLARFASIG